MKNVFRGEVLLAFIYYSAFIFIVSLAGLSVNVFSMSLAKYKLALGKHLVLRLIHLSTCISTV